MQIRCRLTEKLSLVEWLFYEFTLKNMVIPDMLTMFFWNLLDGPCIC